MKDQLYVGVDIGASRTKVALLDAEKKLKGHSVLKSGTDFAKTADAALADALKMAGDRKDVAGCVSTGYGRKMFPFQRGNQNGDRVSRQGMLPLLSRGHDHH
jgi:activator of 2-hydroxyglutaryl-CoA dehydratase